MASDFDELEINPFYRALQKKFVDLYERAQNSCYLLCIPQTITINSDIINLDFVDTHILRPSPYFKGQYMTTHSSNSKTLTLSDNGLYFTTEQGFTDVQDIRILGEELAYNKDYKQYKIIILEAPLDSKFKIQNSNHCDSTDAHLVSSKLSIQECTEFLHSFSEFKEALQVFNQKIQDFRNHYMVLPDYLDDAASRLTHICTETLTTMLSKLKPPLKSSIKLRAVLAEALESYMLHAVYDKVFTVISQHLSDKDTALLMKCHKVNKVKSEQIGVRKEFSCPLPKAVVELANLGTLKTPREKLACLKSTVDNITEGVAVSLEELSQTPNPAGKETESEEICITSDDLIPILVTVIAKAKCCHLLSDLFYVDHFMWASADRDRDDLGFCLVSFKAAVQYMAETDFSSMADCEEEETSLEDMIAATSLLESQSCKESSEKSYPRSRERHERQMNRIIGFLDKTVEELKTQGRNNSKPRTMQSIFPDIVLPAPQIKSSSSTQSLEKSDQLGDFLSALQNDDFDQPFGKQK